MKFLAIVLLFLNVCATMLDCVWLVLALHDTCWPVVLFLRSLSTHIPLPLPPPPKATPPGQRILFRPSFSIHNFCWIILHKAVAVLPSTDRALFTPYMRGSHFAALAESLLADDPAPILARYGIKLSPTQLRRIEHLKSLPEIVLSPPEDGNRKPQRGEKGGRKLRTKKGFLWVPKKVSKAGKAEKQKRKEERKARALAERSSNASA
ncbi:hypothetical protein BDU57DRAFT_540736 [Ampelomyces quisqualis]|uniref:Uncharacterized protein n=1 Tax=Ampelomyces quisqualis TaxID=50730 RepID=A0A6A5QHP5_AMPQU|nr:hypothetical protein BDU57DRAFT_540736 [Ampelomyces quisqualis]